MTSHHEQERSPLTVEKMLRVYRGELHREEDPSLYHFLMEEESQECGLNLFVEEDAALELTEFEADGILQNILRETADLTVDAMQNVSVPQEAKETAPSLWTWLRETWVHAAVLAPIAAGVLVLLSPSVETTTSETDAQTANQQATVKGPLTKSTSNGAYLEIQVTRKDGSKQAFAQQGTYQTGDAFFFSFLVTRPGELMLLREDARGHLEQLYPFSKGAKRVAAGKFALTHNRQIQAYDLDKRVLGLQKLYVVHATKLSAFPSHVRDLNPLQKQMLERADNVSFNVTR